MRVVTGHPVSIIFSGIWTWQSWTLWTSTAAY